MLIRFSIQNFRSFGKHASLSLVANGRLDQLRDHVVDLGDIRLLRGTYIYGANAAGKSNLIKAVDFARQIIVKGSADTVRLDQYCKVCSESLNQPGVFQFEMVVDGKVYSYGFAISYRDGTIVEEWLYQRFKNGSETCLFERDDAGSIDTEMRLKGMDETRFKIYADDMKALTKTLFLTELARKHTDASSVLSAFRAVYKWFKRIIVIFPGSEFLPLPFLVHQDNMREQYERYLRYFDTGISQIEVDTTTLDKALSHLPKEDADQLRQLILQNISDEKEFAVRGPGVLLGIRSVQNGEVLVDKLKLQHQDASEGFDLTDESDGTQRLFDLVPILFQEMNNSVVFVDEIERSMHPLLARRFINLFYEQTRNKQMQLIVTTHESPLLDLTLIRRDEIWFVKRYPEGSKLYSLDDYKVRHDKQIDKDYLLGRYGAVPVFSSGTMQVSEGCTNGAPQT